MCGFVVFLLIVLLLVMNFMNRVAFVFGVIDQRNECCSSEWNRWNHPDRNRLRFSDR